MGKLPDMKGMLIMLGVFAALVGYILGEALRWIASHISVSLM